MFYIYVLQSTKDLSTYIGSTEDLRRRVSEHNQGKTKSIKHKIPFRLVYYEAYLTKKQAIKRERHLKKNSVVKKELFDRIFMAPSSNG